MKAFPGPTTHGASSSTAAKGLISWPLVISLLALLMCTLALFKSQGGDFDFNMTEPQGSPALVQEFDPVELQVCKPIGTVTPPRRIDIADMLLEARQLEIGIELGVQQGEFALRNLREWPLCKRYYLVDTWRQQEIKHVPTNVTSDISDQLFANTKKRLKDFAGKTVFLRTTPADAVPLIKERLDFVYIDNANDYCTAKQAIELYWPLLNSGGILAGHDYVDPGEVQRLIGQDWTVCANGSRHDSAVKAAVNDFIKANGLTLMVTYADSPWLSWLTIKP